MIRLVLSILIIILLGIYTIFSDIVCFFIKDKNKVDNYNFKVVRFVFKLVLSVCNVRIHTRNNQNLQDIKNERSIFIISNHRGYFDILTGYTVLNRNCGIVAKNTLQKVPILGYWMSKIHCLFLDRKNLRSGAMMIVDAVKLIENGISVWIFPEGTRNANVNPSDLLPFKAGSFKIPSKADCYILPMAILNADLVFEKQFPRIKARDVYINFGKAYKMKDLDSEALNNIDKYNEHIISDLIEELKMIERS